MKYYRCFKHVLKLEVKDLFSIFLSCFKYLIGSCVGLVTNLLCIFKIKLTVIDDPVL